MVYRLLRTAFFVLTAAGLAVACGSDQANEPNLATGLSADGFEVSVVVTDLRQPTQFVVDGPAIVVAEINGGEDDASGRVSRIRLPTNDQQQTAEREILLTDLDKPTGVALFDNQLWVMERDRLSKADRNGDNLIALQEDLPNNGRSQGTLTTTADTLLFDTSGQKRGRGADTSVTARSARLWSVTKPDAGYEVSEVASGFKHAYAHAFDDQGRLWTTEMTDGSFDGQRAPDEVQLVVPGADHGWPHCVGDNVAVTEFGGSPERCATTPPSLALLGVSSTPTSIVVSPWDRNELLIALWSDGTIVSVRTDVDDPPVETLVSGLQNPQHLAAHEGALLVTEFGTGRLLRVTK